LFFVFLFFCFVFGEKPKKSLVEPTAGIEPAADRLKAGHSTAELRGQDGHLAILLFTYIVYTTPKQTKTNKSRKKPNTKPKEGTHQRSKTFIPLDFLVFFFF
jgi:hypothetical protein